MLIWLANRPLHCSPGRERLPVKDPSEAEEWPTGYPVWSGTSGASGTGEETEVTFSSAASFLSDAKTVVAKCGSSEQSVNVVVVTVDGIEYVDHQGHWSVPYGPLVVPVGESVAFRAVVLPVGAPGRKARRVGAARLRRRTRCP